MAKYGVFDGDAAQPMQMIEGDKIIQNGEHVQIWTLKAHSTVLDEQVAAVRLAPGRTVRKID